MAELDEAAIFNAARKIDQPDEREAYLRRACGDDLKTLERVEVLLRAYDAQRDFLESPPVEIGPRADNAAVTESPGTVIGRYKLLEKIGEGGFAVVYMAEQTEPIRRQVALKIIKLGMDTRQVIARFEAERQALAMMDHPGIAKVYDAGATETGRPYFVMQLIRGVPISEYCDANSLNTEARLRLFLDVCRAVQHAHQKGIIHRDIKPTNVLVALHDGRPVPKVIDFGIAKATHQRLTEKTLYTSYRQIIGTPQYMSPEQAEFSDLDIDTRSDIYSLGVLLYELLTSTTPFQPGNLQQIGYDEICHTIRHSEPPTPSRRLSTLGDSAAAAAKNRQIDPAGLRKRLSGDLDWIVMKALEKDRTRRYETADALALDIERHLNSEPVGARRISHIERLWRWGKRNRAIAALWLAVAALITFVSIAAPMIAWHQARLVDETRQQLYVKDMTVAYNAWNDRIPSNARDILDRYAAGSDFAHMRDFSWYYLNNRCRRAAGIMSCEKFALSLRTNLLAVIRSDDLIHLYDTRTWSVVGTLPWKADDVCSFRFSPDGRYLGLGNTTGMLSVWNVITRQQLYAIKVDSHTDDVYDLSFSPDGRILATGGRDHDVKIWETNSGTLLRVLKAHRDDVSALAFSPDGKILATGSLDRTLRLWNTDDWTSRSVNENAFNARVFCIAFSTKGDRFAAGGLREIRIWETSGRLLASLPGHGLSLCFSLDDQLLAASNVQGMVNVWDAANYHLREQHVLGNDRGPVAFLSSREMLIVAEGGLHRSEIGTGQLPAIVRRGYSEQIAIDVSAAGDLLVAGYGQYGADPGDGAIVCWDLRRGKDWLLPGHDGSSVFDVAIDPKGERIVAGGGPSDGPGFVKIWDVHARELIAALPEEKSRIIGVAISPSGDRVAYAAFGRVAVWNIRADRPEVVWGRDADAAGQVAYSPDGDLLAVSCFAGDVAKTNPPSVMIWDAETGELLEVAASDRNVMELAFSQGRQLAWIEWNGKVEVYDRRAKRIILSERAHQSIGNSVAFSPDGRTLATGSSGGEIRLWHVPTLMQITTFKNRGTVAELRFFPDGKTLAVGYQDRTVQLWHVDRDHELLSIDGTVD